MERPAARLLEQSSDAVVLVRLADGLVVDVNEALFAMTGHRAEDLVGRSSHELLIWTTVIGHQEPEAGLGWLKSVGDVPAGFWTRTGELRVGDLSVLVIGVGSDRLAVCTLRAGRDPTAVERHGICRRELWRVLGRDGSWARMGEAAVEVLAKCLRWELGAVWQVDPPAGLLRCTHVWCAPASGLEELASVCETVTFRAGEGLLGRVWEAGEPVWVPDVLAHPDLARTRSGTAQVPVHGWVAVPVAGGGELLGVLELVSRAVRRRDQETLRILRWLAAHLETVARGEVPDDPEQRTAAGPELRRDPTELRELASSVGRLNRLLEDLVAADRPERELPEHAPAPGEGVSAGGEGGGVPAGLTLKAVSERTGIPAATVRTWERRYHFLQPTRSSSGYRIYGEEDIARILEVKRLLQQGVRISEAMAAVQGRPAAGREG